MNEPKAIMLSISIAVLTVLFIKYSTEHERKEERNDEFETETEFEEEPVQFINTSNLVLPPKVSQLPNSPVYHSSPRKSMMNRYIRTT